MQRGRKNRMTRVWMDDPVRSTQTKTIFSSRCLIQKGLATPSVRVIAAMNSSATENFYVCGKTWHKTLAIDIHDIVNVEDIRMMITRKSENRRSRISDSSGYAGQPKRRASESSTDTDTKVNNRVEQFRDDMERLSKIDEGITFTQTPRS